MTDIDHRLVINTTPVTIRIAPATMRGVTLSTLRRKRRLKTRRKSGVVFSSGMIADISPRPKATKFST